MFWMVVLYNFETDGDYALLEHNLSYDEATLLCDDYRIDGYPAFLVRQNEYHDSAEIADNCPQCLREIQDVLKKHGIIL